MLLRAAVPVTAHPSGANPVPSRRRKSSKRHFRCLDRKPREAV